MMRTTRSAFSLFEMVLALSLAMVVLLALYFTLNTYITSTHIGRDTLAEGEIARSVMARFTADVTNQLGAFDTRCLPDYSTVAPDAQAAPAAPAEGTIPNSAPADAVRFNLGVLGKVDGLTLSVYRVQKPAAGMVANQTEITSDLRLINYWMVMNGSDAIGLARREVKLATSADIDADPSEIPDQEKHIIAREVKGLSVEYFDGAAWQSSWDGTEPGSAEDGTPIGPPSAIRITATLRRNVNKLLTFGVEQAGPDLTYTHVIALPAANNFTKKSATTTP